MAKGIHKGTELNNVKETWDQNERNRSGESDAADSAATGNEDLQKAIKEEAAAYDQDNAEEKLLGGDRATVNDDATGS